MPQIINTNIASLNAQRNLNASQGAANTALERLSSGLRINSAKDDAAGLAISTRFESQISGLNMAQRNANDGISLAQTAEGALDQVVANLQRIRELAVQSANGTNSESDRQDLDKEVQQRIEEINRIAGQTSFNGLKVLNGTFGTQTFQVGANTGETIGVSGLDSRTTTMGATTTRIEGFTQNDIGDFDGDGETDTLEDYFAAGKTAEFTATINGEDIVIEDAGSMEDILGQINEKTNETGVKAFLDRSNNNIIFSSEFGEEITAQVRNTSTFGTGTGVDQTSAPANNETISVKQLDISTPDGADLAMVVTDYAIDTINGYRAELGAVQNRFESTIANLATTAENLSASNSRIRDADFAAESAELARTQVLQQAGLSVLAQANARPQQVLQLLQG